MSTVTSRDGTLIGFDRIGDGPALVLVDGAMCYRASGPLVPLAHVLASRFTVYTYDRRGRGESGDTPPYAVTREVEDLDAIIAEAGGSAYVFGMSSGAALAIEAAASGSPITKLALYEPPYRTSDADPRRQREYTEKLGSTLAEGRRGDAVELFMRMVGMPAETVAGMRGSPAWPVFEAIAPTLAYDDALLGDGSVPRDRTAKVTVPTLVVAGGSSPAFLRDAARATAEVIPGAELRTLDGQTHMLDPEVVGAVLTEFLA
ncbi:MAG TPA: alpha/beta hydrolase [Micromonosporaceae bacterium]